MNMIKWAIQIINLKNDVNETYIGRFYARDVKVV